MRKIHDPPNRIKTVLTLLRRIAFSVFWGILILLCILFRDQITVENIADRIPQNSAVAILIMLLLYAFKSVTVLIYSGILYAVSGVLFSLPVAIAVNLIGTAIMISIPYWIGRKIGSNAVNHLLQKSKKLELLLDIQHKNEFFINIFIRMVGILPADLVAMFLGAGGMHYRPYVFGSLIGFLPSILCFSVMGMKIEQIGSPEFIIAAATEVGFMLLSLILYHIQKKKSRQKNRSASLYANHQDTTPEEKE